MKKEQVKRKHKPRSNVKNVSISIRVSAHLSKWMRQEDVSPTAIFYEACKEIGYTPALTLTIGEKKKE